MKMLRLTMVGAVLMAMAAGNVSGGEPQMQQPQHFPGQARQPGDRAHGKYQPGADVSVDV